MADEVNSTIPCFLPPPLLNSPLRPNQTNTEYEGKSSTAPHCVSHPTPQNPLRTLFSILNPFRAAPETSGPDDSDGLHARLRARAEDDGVKARLAARRDRVAKPLPAPKRRRRPPSEAPRLVSARTPQYGIPESRLYELVSEATRRREEVANRDVVALLPYDLQRKVFDEIISNKVRKVSVHKDNGVVPEERPDAGWMSAVWGFAGSAVRFATFRDFRKGKEASDDSTSVAAYAAAVEHNNRMAADADVGNSAASAYAAAAAIATSASAVSPSDAEVAGLKAAVAAARAINSEDEATVYLDTVGVVPLLTAARVLNGGDKASALTALANLAILVPKSRCVMLKADEQLVRNLTNVIQKPGRFGVHAVGGLWHTEAVVSGTHLLGSLALARGAGQDARKVMARDKELIRGLTRLAGGLKNGEPEGAARAARRALGALGVNKWWPRMPGQRGLRILCIDGGGTRAIMAFETVSFYSLTLRITSRLFCSLLFLHRFANFLLIPISIAYRSSNSLRKQQDVKYMSCLTS